MMPPRPGVKISRDDLDKRVSGAFAMMKGAQAPAGGNGFDAEQQQEDELIEELAQHLDAATATMAKLRAVQQKEEGSGGAKIDDDSSTGSPSMQGMP